jgi:clan AA aspartic protease (TIGR02281 family)
MLNGSRAGAAMMLIAVSLAGAVKADGKCTLRQIGELTVAPGSLVPVIQAEVDGKPVQMVIDTGSSATSLTKRTAAKLGLTVKQLDYEKMYEGRGEETVGEVGIKSFKVGPLAANNLNLMISGEGSEGGELGIQFLRQSDIEFDLPEGKVRFFKPEGCEGDQVVYWGKAYAVAPISTNNNLGEIDVWVKVSGQPVLAEMATGMDRSVVTPAAARFSMTGPATRTTLGGNAVEGEVATFESFSFGDETIRNAKIGVADLFRKDRQVLVGSRIATEVVHRPDMVLGADFFHSHRIYISKSQNKVYVSYMGGPVFDTRSAAPANESAAGASKSP